MKLSRRAFLVCTASALGWAWSCLPDYEGVVVVCDPNSLPCPDGYVCADPNDLGVTRCINVGCGDGVVDPRTEACDDGNKNDLDTCTSDCELVTLAFDVNRGIGTNVATLTRPSVLATDLNGNVFVAAVGDGVLFKLTRRADDSFDVARIAGNGTMVNAVRVDEGERPDRVSTTFLASMAGDGFGNLYTVNLQEGVVRRIDATTGLIDTVAGTGISVGSDLDDEIGTAISLDFPRGIVTDNVGAVYFIDRAPGVGVHGRVRRLDPDTGKLRTAYVAPPGQSLLELASDVDGTIYALSFSLTRQVPRMEQVFIELDTLRPVAGGALEFVETRAVYSHTEFAGERIPTANELPGSAGNSQRPFVTQDGIAFYFLMGSSVVEVNFKTGEHRIIAEAPRVVTGEVEDVVSEVLPFSLLPSDIAIIDNVLFVADPGSNVVYRVPLAGAPHGVLDASDVAAGKLAAVGAVSNVDLLREFAVGFARESDGHVSVSPTNDCCLQETGRPCPNGGLSARGIEFSIAFPDVHRVLFSSCSSTVGLLSGNGEPGFSGDGERADRAVLNRPTAMIRVDKGGDDDFFFIADSGNNRVRRLFNAGRERGFELLIDTFLGGSDVLGVPLRRPSGLAVDDAGHLLVADSGNDRVLRVEITPGGGVGAITVLADASSVREPIAIVFLPFQLVQPDLAGGFLLVVERAGHRVLGGGLVGERVSLAPLAGDGTPGDGDAVDATTGQLRFPRSIMFGPDVDLSGGVNDLRLSFFVSDAIDRLRQVDLHVQNLTLSAELTTRDGAGFLSRLDGPAAGATLRSPTAVAALDEDHVLVVDRGTGRVRRFTLSTLDVVTVLGLPDGVAAAEGSLAALAEPLVGPGGIAVQRSAAPPVVWLSEGGAGRLRRLTLVDEADPSTWTASTAASAELSQPLGLAIDGDRLFVADAGAHVVLRYDVGTVSSESGASINGTVIAGTPGARGFFGDGGPATSALLSGPQSVAVRDSRVLVADTGNNRVRRIDTDSGTIRTILGDGAAANGGEGSGAFTFPVRAPRGLAIDDAGNVLVGAGSAVRFIAAGDARKDEGIKVADKDDDVTTVFGRPERQQSFPESVTRCIEDIAILPGPTPTTLLVDSCAGTLIPLTRILTDADGSVVGPRPTGG